MALLSSRWFFWVGVVLTASGAVLFAAPASAVGARPHRSTERSRPPPAEEPSNAVGQQDPRIGGEPGVSLDPQEAEEVADHTRIQEGELVMSQTIGETPWHRDVALALLGAGALALGSHGVASRRNRVAHLTQ